MNLDWLTEKKFNSERISRLIISMNRMISTQGKHAQHGPIDGIPVTFFFYPYKNMRPYRLYPSAKTRSPEAILRMKSTAVSQRAEKKDFFELYELSKPFNISGFPRLVIEKYGAPKINPYPLAKFLLYFDKAAQLPDPSRIINHLGRPLSNISRRKKTI